MRIDPWASTQYRDYLKLREEFRIEDFSEKNLPNPPKLMRRGIIFGQRGFEFIEDAITNKKPFAIMTGLMPSGRMHIGHKMHIDQIKYYQKLGAEIFIAVADFESWATRALSLKKAREIAICEYVKNYAALGLKSENCHIYFQSEKTAVKDLAHKCSKHVNLSEMRAIYGFGGETTLAHLFSPIIQSADILHPQLPEFGGQRPVLVPVGLDQDPHIRLTREIASAFRIFNKKVENRKVGIFVKPDENVKELLNRAKKGIKEHFKDEELKIKLNVPYKALYLEMERKINPVEIEEILIKIEKDFDGFAFYPPSATFHRFMSGLKGEKMSSSEPDYAIFLTDLPEDAQKKVKRAKTGGGVSIEEQRRNGGNPDDCVVFELHLYHLIESDLEVKKIYEDCKEGKLLCGECKKMAAGLMGEFLEEHQEKRECVGDVRDYLEGFLA